jgi:phospholipid/cholesterol/gamma-HCH transport system ATP-binding protein
MLQVKNLSHSFGERKVLADINFEVGKGEVLVIMGSSGGGKTTLLRCITGLIQPTEGSIEVDGVDMRLEPELARQKLGLVFQNAALFDYLNVFDNVSFGLERRPGVKKSAVKTRVKELLSLVGLENAESLGVSQLSGGMKKRVGLARALALDPEVILYDEPTSGLDPVTAYSIDQLIVQMQKELDVTSVVVSHDVSSVLRVATKILFLERGHMAFYGTPQEFKEVRTGAVQSLLTKARAEYLSME